MTLVGFPLHHPPSHCKGLLLRSGQTHTLLHVGPEKKKECEIHKLQNCLSPVRNTNLHQQRSHETLEMKFHDFSMTKSAIFHDHFRGEDSRNFSQEIISRQFQKPPYP